MALRELEWNSAPFARIDSAPSDPARTGGTGRQLWEDALTLVLTAAAFMCVAANVHSANWVEGLPSLYPIGLAALGVAYGMSRVRLNQLLLIPAGLFAGAAVVYFQIISLINGGSLYVRTDHLLDRMYVWWSAVTRHGTSVDPLPVIAIMLVATWLGSFVAAWAILRWRNAVIGLIPGAAALIWDSGFSSSQFSVTAVIYLILGVLLFMRLRVAGEQQRWAREDVPYPPFMALSALNVTFVATLVLLGAAWALPAGAESSAANERWSVITGPLTRRLSPIAGAFISINPDKGLKIHALRDALILQGRIDPALIPAAQISGEIPPDVAPFLRDQSFEQYRRDGWHVNEQADVPLPPGQASQVADDATGIDPLTRKTVAIKVKVQGGNGDRLLSIGQPLRSDSAARSSIGSAPADVSGLEADHHLSNGTQYTAVGSVSAATVDQLRAAGTAYPDWVTQGYLQVSRRVPPRVNALANEISAGTSNPYDAATAIEDYLRTFPIDYNVPRTPEGQDGVDYFLFDTRRGYFDYHASAMAVMLRTLGIPARLASGFVIEPSRRQGESAAYKLTQQQAFAWPEVFFPSIGWVEFNPTPSQPLVPRPATPQTQVPQEPSLDLASADGSSIDITIRSLPGVDALLPGFSPGEWLKAVLTLGAAVTAAGLLAVVLAWELRVRGLGLPARLWEKSLVLGRLGNTPPQPHETPRAYAVRLAEAVPRAAAIVDIAASYERARFGHKTTSGDEARRLRDAWSSTRGALLRRILRIPHRS